MLASARCATFCEAEVERQPQVLAGNRLVALQARVATGRPSASTCTRCVPSPPRR